MEIGFSPLSYIWWHHSTILLPGDLHLPGSWKLPGTRCSLHPRVVHLWATRISFCLLVSESTPGRVHSLVWKLAPSCMSGDSTGPLSTLVTLRMATVSQKPLLPLAKKPGFLFCHLPLSVLQTQRGSHFKALKIHVHERAPTSQRMLGCHPSCSWWLSELLCLCNCRHRHKSKPPLSLNHARELKRSPRNVLAGAEGDPSSDVPKISPLWKRSHVPSTWLYSELHDQA